MSENYSVSEQKVVVIIEDDGVTYTIKKEGWILTHLSVNYGRWYSDVFIPHTFPSGHRIDALGENSVSARVTRVTVADEIKVLPKAFRLSECTEVVWPSGCKVIPHHCFTKSHIRKITNIEKVEVVEKNAFEKSDIEEIVWPENCPSIPEFCFWRCNRLSRVDMPYVKNVEEYAFALSKLKSVVWPSSCKSIPDCCFASTPLTTITNTGNVERIGYSAFALTKLKSLDLSSVQCLERGSLVRLSGGCKIIPSYYVAQKDYEEAFLEKIYS